ncbi:SMC-Scp complex subunit ScpB [bacterium]|nr:SMC-Scp complex subunit ScpB [bacterium]
MNDLKNKVEAIIFISESPVKSKEIANFLDEDIKAINETLKILVEEWKNRGNSIKIEEIAGGFQFRTKEEYKEILIEYVNKKPYKLSRAGLEVVGIIAKKQPITKIEIDKIRGVDSVGAINVLIERELIEVIGEKDVPGRPYLYSTTELFLEVFSLNSIHDLPGIEEFDDYEKEVDKNPD